MVLTMAFSIRRRSAAFRSESAPDRFWPITVSNPTPAHMANSRAFSNASLRQPSCVVGATNRTAEARPEAQL